MAPDQYFLIGEVYGDETLPESKLQSISNRYHLLRNKRKELFDRALSYGLRTSVALVIKREVGGPIAKGSSLSDLLDRHEVGPMVVLDRVVGPPAILGSPGEVIRRLEGSTESTEVFIVRSFLEGLGVMIAFQGDEQFRIELAKTGLQTLTRGTGPTQTIDVKIDPLTGSIEVQHQTMTELGPAHHASLSQACIFTKHALETFSQSFATEWIIDQSSSTLIDFSPLRESVPTVIVSRPSPQPENGKSELTLSRTLSAGDAAGHVLDLRLFENSLLDLTESNAISIDRVPSARELADLEDIINRIERIDGPVIIVSSRALAGLAPLANLVAGFVVEQGSELTHLAIVARELGVPLVEIDDVPEDIRYLEIHDQQIWTM